MKMSYNYGAKIAIVSSAKLFAVNFQLILHVLHFNDTRTINNKIEAISNAFEI